MPELQFRTAGLADMQDIIDLVTSAYRGESSRAGWTTEADLLTGLRVTADVLELDIADSEGRIVLAVEDEGLLACMHAKIVESGRGYLGMFAVRPGLQGTGIGRIVLAEGERTLIGMGAHAAEMTVIEQRVELIEYYERRGYRRTGEHSPFPYGDERFGIPLRDDLRMVVLRKDLVSGGER